MELLKPWQVPLEGCHRIGHFEVASASRARPGERALRACSHRLREGFRIDERIGDPVRAVSGSLK